MSTNHTYIILAATDGQFDVYDFPRGQWGQFNEDSFTDFDQLTYIETLDELPLAWKHADPTEDARWVYTERDIQDIESYDRELLLHTRRIHEDQPQGPDHWGTWVVASAQ